MGKKKPADSGGLTYDSRMTVRELRAYLSEQPEDLDVFMNELEGFSVELATIDDKSGTLRQAVILMTHNDCRRTMTLANDRGIYATVTLPPHAG